jgi:hypothetical protein
MPAYRHTALHQERHRRRHGAPALELDHVGQAFLHQPAGTAQRLLGTFLVGKEGQVGHQQGAFEAARHTAGVIDHVVQGHRHRGGLALHHVAERIADQHHVDAGRVQQAGEGIVIRRQRGNALAGALHLQQGIAGDGHACGSSRQPPAAAGRDILMIVTPRAPRDEWQGRPQPAAASGCSSTRRSWR